MLLVAVVPALLQAAAMAVDEGWFHRRRGLARWERRGHPIDTATVALCYAWLVAAAPSSTNAVIYVALALISCVTITKDEWIHARSCTPGEHWLHAILFVLHPIVLGSFGVLWWSGGYSSVLVLQLALTAAFGLFQILYWNVAWRRLAGPES